MKKSLKVFCAVIACIVLMCPLFAGCVTDGYLVHDSFECNNIQSGYVSVSVGGTFQIYFKQSGIFSVSYDLNLYYGSQKKLVATKNLAEEVKGNEKESKKLSFYSSFPVTWDIYGYSNTYEVRISNVKISAKNKYDTSQDYAIGFGVTAAVLTCGITAFFIITKLREKKD